MKLFTPFSIFLMIVILGILYDNERNETNDIKDTKVRMLLTHYFVKYAKNLNYLFTTSGGKRCSDSNIANSLSNFCRLYFKVPLTLGEIRAGFPKNTRDVLKKEIFENF